MADNNNVKVKPLPLATRLKLFLYERFRNACTRRNGTVNRRLFNLIDFKAAAATKRINSFAVSTSDVSVDPTRNLWFRLFTPAAAAATLPLLVYFHGGGFSNYGADSKIYDELCRRLSARIPAVIVSVNYRLAPRYKYPSQYDDGFDALKFIDAKWREILPATVDPGKCFLGGDSAGGNIAHHVTVRALETADFNNVRIAGIVSLQPFFGGEERSESELRLKDAPVLSVKETDVFWREFLPENADRNHPAAKVFGGGIGESVDFPISLVIVGGRDPLQDWDRKYVEWLRDCGKKVEVKEYANAFHGFYLFPELPEFASLMDDVAEFMQKRLHHGKIL